jgi:hypothetical protein
MFYVEYKKMEGGTGFEPVNGGFADRSVSTSPSALISANLIISQAPRRVKNGTLARSGRPDLADCRAKLVCEKAVHGERPKS